MSNSRAGLTVALRGLRAECDRHKQTFAAEFEEHSRWLEAAVAQTKQRAVSYTHLTLPTKA